MKVIPQPEPSNVCGQACVAMIANISLDDSIKLFRSKSATRTKQVARVLQKLAFQCEDKLKRITKDFILPIAGIYLFKLTYNNKKGSHWTIWNGKENCWYDPGRPNKLHRDYHWIHKETMYPTSYLQISSPPKYPK